MTRRSYGVSGPNNPAKPVSANWFNDLNELLSNGIAMMPQDFYEATDPNMGPAVQRALANIDANKTQNIGYGGGRLYFPKSSLIYDLGESTIDLTCQIDLFGDGPASTIIRMGDATAIRIQRYNTSGATDVLSTPRDAGGDGSCIRNLSLYGTGSTTLPYASEREFHAVEGRARFQVSNVDIYNFKGDGIRAVATAGGGPGAGVEGNANLFKIDEVLVQGCRDGLLVDGADSNAGKVYGLNGKSCRRWVVRDSSFLNTTYVGCHADSSTVFDGGLSVCSHNGNLYAVNHGGEEFAAEFPPTGTTESNLGWIYVGAGGPIDGYGRRAWVSGMTWRSGGAYCSDDTNSETAFYGCYSEAGQPPSQMKYPARVDGGKHAAGIYRIGYGTPYGGRLTSYFTDGLEVPVDFGVGRDLLVGREVHVAGQKVLGERQVRPGTPTLADVVALLDAHQLWA